MPAAYGRFADIAEVMGVDTHGMTKVQAADAALRASVRILRDVGIPERFIDVTQTSYSKNRLGSGPTQYYVNSPVIKGDQVVASVAAASILAKVTRDRIMAALHEDLPMYGFDEHKGYCTGAHSTALMEHGPSAVHRWSYVNVAAAGMTHRMRPPHPVALSVAAAAVVQNGQVGRPTSNPLTTPTTPTGAPVEQEERETA